MASQPPPDRTTRTTLEVLKLARLSLSKSRDLAVELAGRGSKDTLGVRRFQEVTDMVLAEIDAAIARESRSDPLDEALNSGDGSYKP